jgi:hypothetical protein
MNTQVIFQLIFLTIILLSGPAIIGILYIKKNSL